jgi:hypothetical protein
MTTGQKIGIVLIALIVFPFIIVFSFLGNTIKGRY